MGKTISKLENEIKERNNYANSLDEKLNEINNNIEEDKKNKSTVFLNDHIQKLKTKLTQKEKELKNLKNSIKHLKEELLLDAEKAEKQEKELQQTLNSKTNVNQKQGKIMEIQKKRLEAQIRKLNSEINDTMKKCEKLKGKEFEWNAREVKIKKEVNNEINMRLRFEDNIKNLQQENENLSK